MTGFVPGPGSPKPPDPVYSRAAFRQKVAMSNAMIWWGAERPPLQPMTALGENALPGHLGIEFVDCGDDWIRARMPVDERTQQPFKRLHGATLQNQLSFFATVQFN